MPGRDQLKAAACARIDGHRELILGIVERIYREPETGFRERQTARAVEEAFDRLGIPYQPGLAVTGVKGEVKAGAAGPSVCIMGELDGLIVPDHVDAHPERQTAHACGHNGQIGSMLGATIGLMAPEVLPHLAGRIVPMAVPAEECIEIGHRLGMRNAGEIEFILGKPELVRLGAFDDVDMAMMVHASSTPEGRFQISSSNNGAIIKQARFLGRAAHAGGAPHRGINALRAAMLALAGIDAQRETFKDADTVRVHPIITEGGRSASIIPADVRMETFVRARTLEAIEDANMKVDRALRAGAIALGATVEITTVPGYLPLEQDQNLVGLFRRNAAALVGEGEVQDTGHRTGSTDAGDLSQIMPVLHPHAGGAEGTGHGADFRIVDADNVVLNAAKGMAMTVIDLLSGDAAEGRRVLAEFTPKLSRSDYLAALRRLAYERTYAE
ncbi:MAG: amidohydrolase [Dehalococcoidia bacterium]